MSKINIEDIKSSISNQKKPKDILNNISFFKIKKIETPSISNDRKDNNFV